MADDDEQMPDLDPQLAALISAYEVETTRDAAQVEAALARVTASAAASGGVGASATITTKIAIVSGIVGLVGVVGVAALRPSQPVSAPPPPSQTAIVPAASVGTHAPEAARPVAPPAATTAAATPVKDDDARAERRAKSIPPSRPPRSPAPPESSLKAELELLQRARGALRRGDSGEALELVRQHRREYPASAIAEERDATEKSALCARDRVDPGACP